MRPDERRVQLQRLVERFQSLFDVTRLAKCRTEIVPEPGVFGSQSGRFPQFDRGKVRTICFPISGGERSAIFEIIRPKFRGRSKSLNRHGKLPLFRKKHRQREQRGVIARLKRHNLPQTGDRLALSVRLNHGFGEIMVIVRNLRPQRDRLPDQCFALAELSALEMDDSQKMNRIRVGRFCPENLPIKRLRLVKLSRLMMLECRLKSLSGHLFAKIQR